MSQRIFLINRQLISKKTMSIQQFDENKHSTFLIDLLYKTRDQTSDVTFYYNGPNGDTAQIQAHRSVLAISSTVFHDLFYGPRAVTGDIPTRSSTIPSQSFEAFVSLSYGMHLINII